MQDIQLTKNNPTKANITKLVTTNLDNLQAENLTTENLQANTIAINSFKPNVLKLGKDTIDVQIAALKLLKDSLDNSFLLAHELILNCRGRLIITGMGKSGLVGRKIAATMASTGTPAFFVHPGEAGHGDLGMIVRGDVVLAISNSGNSDEINLLLPVIKRLEIPLISISKDLSGKLPQAADIALTLGSFEEACPMQLAPTSSTTATMALGDALAMTLLQSRGFQQKDFALSHPAGSLGKRLLTQVADLMHTGSSIPIVDGSTSIIDALLEITDKRLGMTIVDDQNSLGILTDGDIRRLLSKQQDMNMPIATVMKDKPLNISHDKMATEALKLMRDRQVNQLLVTDDQQQLIGVLTIRDLIASGIG